MVSHPLRKPASRPRMHVRQPSTARRTVGFSNRPANAFCGMWRCSVWPRWDRGSRFGRRRGFAANVETRLPKVFENRIADLAVDRRAHVPRRPVGRDRPLWVYTGRRRNRRSSRRRRGCRRAVRVGRSATRPWPPRAVAPRPTARRRPCGCRRSDNRAAAQRDIVLQVPSFRRLHAGRLRRIGMIAANGVRDHFGRLANLALADMLDDLDIDRLGGDLVIDQEYPLLLRGGFSGRLDASGSRARRPPRAWPCRRAARPRRRRGHVRGRSPAASPRQSPPRRSRSLSCSPRVPRNAELCPRPGRCRMYRPCLGSSRPRHGFGSRRAAERAWRSSFPSAAADQPQLDLAFAASRLWPVGPGFRRPSLPRPRPSARLL